MFFTLRVILLYGTSNQGQNEFTNGKAQKFGIHLLQNILKAEQDYLNYHFLILSAIFMVVPNQQKTKILESFYESGVQQLEASNTREDLVSLILLFFYKFTCTRNNEFESLLREVLFFNADITELCLPLNITWALGMINLRKSFFKDLSPPEWYKEELKPKLVRMSQTLNQRISENIEEYMAHPNLLALVIYYNYLTISVDKEHFTMLTIVKDFEQLKKNVTKSSKTTEIIQVNYEVLEAFEAYDQFDDYSKIQYLVQLFFKFISLNITISSKNQLNGPPQEEEANVQTKLWEDVLGLLEQVDQRLSSGIGNFLEQALSRSEKFSSVGGQQEKKKLLYDFLLNVYFFSRYTYFNISPKLLSIDPKDPIAALVLCLTDIKNFEQNVETRFEDFYKLHKAKDFNNFFLKLISFCFLPNAQLKKSNQSSQDSSVNALYELAREIMVLSVLKGEILRLFTVLTKKVKEEFGKSLPDEPLNKTFISCAEYLISNKENPIEELPQVYQLFPFETQPANKKFFFRLFIEIKKFSYLIKNLYIYCKCQIQGLLDPSQILKLGNILRKLFLHATDREFTNPIGKAGFMLLLEMSQNNQRTFEKVPVEYLNWIRVATALENLQGTELTKCLLNFSLAHIRPFPGIKQLIDRGIELKRNTVLPYLLNKSSLSLLEIFAKLYSGPILTSDEELGAKEGELPNVIEGSDSKTKADSLARLLSKKISKRSSFGKTGKKKVDSSKKRLKSSDNAIQIEEPKVQFNESIVQELAAQLYNNVTDEVFDYFSTAENQRNFGDLILKRVMDLPYDTVKLKNEFDNLMEVESELKLEEFYLLFQQNEFACLLEFIDSLNRTKIQGETDKTALERNLDILIGMINVILKCLLIKIQKAHQARDQPLLELRGVAGLFINTLQKLTQIIIKERESLKPFMVNEIIYNFLTFICENDLRSDISSEVNHYFSNH